MDKKAIKGQMNAKKPYIPVDFPPQLDADLLLKPIGDANSALSEFVGSLKAIENPSLLLHSFFSAEAVLSSRIEGTQTQLEDIIGPPDEDSLKNKDDYKEVINYVSALHLGSKDKRLMTLSDIREYHKILLQDSSRGSNKHPGQFREKQNWIGDKNTKKEEARFIPPEPIHIPEALENWINYLKLDTQDALLQISLLHAQFEIIHPFDDGNGRVGRLLIPLFLYQKNRIPQPCFYLSEYLEKNRDEYYSRLFNITAHKDWMGWVLFFLKAIEEQSNKHEERIRIIIALRKSILDKYRETIRSQHFPIIVDFMFKKLIFTTTNLCNELNINSSSALNVLRKLSKHKVLIEKRGSGRRATQWVFTNLLQILYDK